MSPIPVSVQRKEPRMQRRFIKRFAKPIDHGQPRLLELTCEKVEGKKASLLIGEVLAVQLYEKAAAAGGSKRPGFSLDS